MTSADLVTIRDLEQHGAITAIQDGNHGELHPTARDYVPDGVPFVMSRNITDGVLDLDDCERITRDRAEALRVGFAKPGDVLLTHKGTLGLSARVPDVDPYVVLTPQVTYYRTNPDLLDPEYFKYAFQHPDFVAQMQSIGNQSTRPFVSITTQRHLEIYMWPLVRQRKIATILESYDSLIRNNSRRIDLLKEVAHRIYSEWFVDFRYPGHEEVALERSELGVIPKG